MPMKVDITLDNIQDLANTYYQAYQDADKSDFFKELFNPVFFKDYVNPLPQSKISDFSELMDSLNNKFQRRDLGAFYTPEAYAKLGHQLLYDAIRLHQDSGKSDYVIIDRAAGTGNLEVNLNQNVPEDIKDKDILSHVIVNTLEPLEYLVLKEKLEDKVRLVLNTDALSSDFLEHPDILNVISDPDTTVIILENPPYGESTSILHQKSGKGTSSSGWKKSLGVSKAKSVLSGAESNDMVNVFIANALTDLLKSDTDSLIVYAPIKYWKNGDWFKLRFQKGIAMNRRYFNASSDTVVSCIHWTKSEQSDNNPDKITLSVYDIEDNQPEYITDINVFRVSSTYSQTYYDKRTFDNDVVYSKESFADLQSGGEWFRKDGSILTDTSPKVRVSTKENDNIVGYLTAQSKSFENPALMTILLRGTAYNGNGFYLRSDNFQDKLPMFAAGWWSTYNSDWWKDGLIYRTGDGSKKYLKDLESNKPETLKWLDKITFYTTLEYYNRSRSVISSSGNLILNELSLDHMSNSKKPLALTKLKNNRFFNDMSADEQSMHNLWIEILDLIKGFDEYKPEFTYTPYQIDKEINLKTKSGGKNIYRHPDLQKKLKTMRQLIKDYYLKEILEGLFHYSFLK